MSTTCRDLAGSRLPTPSEHVARAQVADAQTLDIDMMCATRLAFAERAGVTPRVGSAASRFTAAPVPVRRRRTPSGPTRPAAPAPATARLRPGRQGVQRIYRMTTEKAQIGVYEYLESIGVPRVNALQVQSKASEWFEFENAKAGGDADAPFGVREMRAVVEFLEERGVKKDDIGALVTRHPPVLAYSVERRLAPLFAYLGELGMDTDQVVEISPAGPTSSPGPGSEHATHGGLSYVQRKLAGRGARVSPEDALRVRHAPSREDVRDGHSRRA